MTFRLLFLTPLLRSLPIATLAATIIVAVVGLVDLATLRHAWHYDRADAVDVSERGARGDNGLNDALVGGHELVVEPADIAHQLETQGFAMIEAPDVIFNRLQLRMFWLPDAASIRQLGFSLCELLKGLQVLGIQFAPDAGRPTGRAASICGRIASIEVPPIPLSVALSVCSSEAQA